MVLPMVDEWACIAVVSRVELMGMKMVELMDVE
jgi:hypothetical protein